MNTRAHRYGRPIRSEDPVKDAIDAYFVSVNLKIHGLRRIADNIERLGDTAEADQIRMACTALDEESETLWNRVSAVRETEEES